MKYRQLPRTDLQLSEVGFGVWTVATDWWGKRTDEEQASLLENALELGVNFFDMLSGNVPSHIKVMNRHVQEQSP